MGLTPKQEKFCHAYMETGNASEAYRQSYSCGRMKEATINVKASELLKHGKVAVRLNEIKNELKETSDIKKERVLFELEAIMEAKISDYIEIKGGSVTLKDFSKLTEAQLRAVESVKETKYGIELKLHGKSWTTDRIVKMLGYEAPRKLNVDGAPLGILFLEPRDDE
ncbi:MAG: terminase small subunit [Bacteroidales bacterium]|nr:terminase small subunit [Bacteroidales bacterium]